MPDVIESVPPQAGSDDYGPTGNPGPGEGTSTIDAPQANQKGTELKLEARSVKTVQHAWQICRNTEQANRQRAARTSDLQALHDGAPPRSSWNQAEKGKSWQSNASTNWLSGIVGRVGQRFVNANISEPFVTASSLPDSIPDWKTKSDLMRAKFTSLIRSWNGYTGFINTECVETVLQGYCYAVFLDPYTWKPTFFKQDWAFCPDYTGQHARDLQFFVAKMDYRLDEFILLFKDEKAAEDTGYDIKNCVWAASHAIMQNPPEDAMTTQPRTFQEMINEGVFGLTYTSSAPRIVKTYLLFNREYDGKVSFWLIDRDSGKQLRFSHKLFPSMEDAITMFSFEPGNGCIHGSKGLGRKLANLAIMKEIFRNGIIDNSRISGLMVLRVDGKDKTKFAPMVMSPFIMVDKGVEIPNQQFTANADSYRIVDQLIDLWAEQSAGAYITQIDDQGKTEKTATEAQIDANRAAESADIQIRRQKDQMAGMTQIQQLRVFSDDNIATAKRIYDDIVADPKKDTPEIYEREGSDADVMRCIVEIMFGNVTEDEIKLFRKSPASAYAHVSTDAMQQSALVAAPALDNNPYVDQSKWNYQKIEAAVGAKRATELYIPTPDETVVAEAERQQQQESVAMTILQQPVPVSPRDNHLVHGLTVQKLLTEFAAPALSSAQPDPTMEKTAALNLNHLGEHLRLATEQGLMKDDAMKELQKFYDGFKKQLAEVVTIRAEAQAAQQATQAALAATPVPEAPIASTESVTTFPLPDQRVA